MPKLGLEIRATLMGIGKVHAAPNYAWHFVVKCTNCGEDSSKPVVFSADDEVQQVRTGTVNLVVTCKFCKRSNDIKVMAVPADQCYEEDDSDQWKLFCAFECRGVEPVRWEMVEPLKIVGSTGYVFENELDDNEFYDYDDKTKAEVSVTDFEWRIVKL